MSSFFNTDGTPDNRYRQRVKRRKSCKKGKKWKHEQYFTLGKTKCAICGEQMNWELGEVTMDHIIPLAQGGKDAKSNWQLAHLECNKSKGSSK